MPLLVTHLKPKEYNILQEEQQQQNANKFGM